MSPVYVAVTGYVASHVVLCGAIVVLFLLILIHCLSQIRFPPEIPRVRENGRTRFSFRTRLAYYTDCESLFREAYETYSKHGKTCLIPGLGYRDEVILPRDSLRWLNSQPGDKIGSWPAFLETDQAIYSLGDTKYFLDDWGGPILTRKIMKELESLVLPMNDELKFSVDARLGTDMESWTDIALLKTMKLLVAQASSRFTIGTPLCRNEGYLNDSVAYLDEFVLNGGIVGAMPANFLRPVAGSIVSMFARYRLWKIKNVLRPLYEERVRFLEHPNDEKSSLEPKDHLQALLRYAYENRPAELNLHDITVRICTANLASIHQTSFALTNLLLNIVASDSEYNTISVIRDEISNTFGTETPVWTKTAVSKMIRLDSIIRETLRLHSFANRGLLRMVMANEGLRTEDGLLLPKGSIVSFVSHPAQCDGDIFDDPLRFDPFRFSRAREEATSASEVDQGITSSSALKQNFVSTGPHFLLFGHGKHACPGRFLLDFELKIIVTYILTHYDIQLPPQYKGQRPKTSWMAEACFPDSEGKIRVKRRKA